MRKEHKSKTGGLTKAGRDYFKRTEGANLKAPVKKGVIKKNILIMIQNLRGLKRELIETKLEG